MSRPTGSDPIGSRCCPVLVAEAYSRLGAKLTLLQLFTPPKPSRATRPVRSLQRPPTPHKETFDGRYSVRRIILLTLGWEELPRSFSVHGDTSGARLREPVPGILLQADGGWVLLDTGFNPALVSDGPLYRRFHSRNHAIEAFLPAGTGDPLEQALERASLALEDIKGVAVSRCTTITLVASVISPISVSLSTFNAPS